MPDLPRATLADLKGGDAPVNAAAIRDVLAGKAARCAISSC